MTRAVVTIHGQADRERAARWAMHARDGMRVEFKEAKRSLPQNDKLWACLTDVAAQITWHGLKLPADDWKFIFLDALKRELRMVPNIDGTGFVNLGRSSSDLSKDEMSNLIELVHAFGAQHGVTFNDTEDTNSSQADVDSPDAEMKPAADTPLEAAGNLIQEQSTSPSLPDGWTIEYSAALRRAQKKESLAKLATQFWNVRGGWAAHKNGPNGATAGAIYDACANNFGNQAVIDDLLREVL